MIPQPPEPPLTVEDLIAKLRAVSGMVVKETRSRNQIRHVAFLPQQRIISGMMFNELKARKVLAEGVPMTKDGVTTQTFRIS